MKAKKENRTLQCISEELCKKCDTKTPTAKNANGIFSKTPRPWGVGCVWLSALRAPALSRHFTTPEG
jgi:hypothetical protein